MAGGLFEPRNGLLADLDVRGAVNVLRFDAHRIAIASFLQRGRDDVRELVGELFRLLDRRGKRDSSSHRLVVPGVFELRAAFGQAVPAADHARDIVERQFAVAICGELALKRIGHGVFIYGEDQHLVVGEQFVRDGFAERQLVEHRAEDGLVVHGGQHDLGLFRFRLGLIAVDPWRRSHVEPFVAADDCVVVHLHEGRLISLRQGAACRSVRFVANDQIKPANPCFLSRRDHINRLIRRERNRHPRRRCTCLPLGKQRLDVSGCRDLKIVRRHVLVTF